MNIYHGKYRIWIKTIAMAVVCLFLVNDIVWAYPDNKPAINSSTLAVQSIFKPLKDAGIEDSAELVFEILAGIRLLHAGKTTSAVNGILTETYRNTKDKRKIEFLPDVNRENGQTIAKFKVIGRDDIAFEIKYQDTKTKLLDETKRKAGDDVSVTDAKLHEAVTTEKLTYGNVFQENDVITITKANLNEDHPISRLGHRTLSVTREQILSGEVEANFWLGGKDSLIY
jgi:hypothetical protein